eukprot:14451495-Alexandrium_andersonii.AAC.1
MLNARDGFPLVMHGHPLPYLTTCDCDAAARPCSMRVDHVANALVRSPSSMLAYNSLIRIAKCSSMHLLITPCSTPLRSTAH